MDIRKLLYVGIDTHKESFSVYAQNNECVELMAQTDYKHNTEEYARFIGSIEAIVNITKTIPIFGMESTGIYHVALYDYLRRRYYQVRVFNGLELRGIRKSRIRKTITDAISAKLISDYLRICYNKEKTTPLPPELRNLREFCRIRERLTRKSTRIKNQLIRDLDMIFPGLTEIFSDVLSKSCLALLEQACTPKEIMNIPKEKLRGYVSEKVAIKLKNVAANAVPACDFDKSITFEIGSLCREAKCILREIEAVEKEIEKEYSVIKTPLKSINGIGKSTGPVILTEIGNINNFEYGKNIVGFAGIDPVIKESGKSRKEYHISKRGSASLRRALYQSAFIGTRCNPVLRAYYKKKIKEGKKHKDAVVCCARKLCHIIHSVLRNNREFYVPSYIPQ